ncbi:EMILIN-2 [Alosa alosa]|uniref:EMILIN-2 n=1 Tax=Alosa alosa TaxID=278164 RepID=UPI0020153811|nr:EMILIN-2 [Alosa alosa]
MEKLTFCGIHCIVFCFILTFTLNNASPPSLFQGAPYSGAVHRHRNKNWCAFIVQKNVTCAVQAGVGSFEEPGVAPCPPHQPDCEQQVMYHTRFRPTYRIAYKTVTELEWRCCPGFQGPDCRELRGSQNRGYPYRQTPLEPQNDPQARPDISRYPQRPERRDIPYHDVRRSGVDKARLLEGEVQKLSQAVQDLQAAMVGMSENLRTNLQEDTSKMLVTLLNNMRPPDSARSGGTEETPGLLLDGHLAVRGHVDEQRGMEEVMARLDGVTDTLKSKDEALEELRRTVSRQSDQIRMLMDTSQGPLIGGASPDLDVLQSYVDQKFDKLKRELTDNIEDKITGFKNTCNDRMTSVESLCQEEHQKIYTTLTELMDAKHDDLKKEISSVRLDIGVADGPILFNRDSSLPLQQDGNDQNELRREIQRVADAHRILNARMDNELEHLSMLQLEDVFGPRIEELEDRMNVTEKNAELHSIFVEEKLTKTIADEVAALRQLMEDRLYGMEDQFTTMLVEMSNNSLSGLSSGSVDALQTEINSNKLFIQTLDDKINAVGEICQTKDCKPGLGGLDGILRDVRRCKNELEVLGTDVSQNADKIKQLEGAMDRLSVQNQFFTKDAQDLLNKVNNSTNNVDHLTSSVAELKDSMNKCTQDYQSLNATCCRQGQAGQGLTRAHDPSVHLEPTNQVNGHQIEELKISLLGLHGRVTAELSRCNDSSSRMNEAVADLNGRVSKLEKICGKEDGASGTVPGAREKPAFGLDPIRQLNSTVRLHTLDIRNLQSSMHNVQIQLASLAKDKDATAKDQVPLKPHRPAGPTIKIPPRQPQINQIHIIPQRVPVQPRQPAIAQQPTITLQQPGQRWHPQQPALLPRQPTVVLQPSNPLLPNQPQVPRRPVVETGEAGPPGYQRRVMRRHEESNTNQKPVMGFAGAPGYPPVNPVAFKTNPFAVSQMPYKAAAHIPLVTPVAAQSHAPGDPLSFSAGLTSQPFSGDFSVVRFNRVLVNDGGHYSLDTGIFTVPMEGRYLVTAVLTAQRGERVEAVLSVSNRSVQKLDTAGYGQGELATDKDKCACGGSASFSIVLPLRKGDRVGVVRTAGKLAVSESREILSTFSAIFLYSQQSSR